MTLREALREALVKPYIKTYVQPYLQSYVQPYVKLYVVDYGTEQMLALFFSSMRATSASRQARPPSHRAHR